MRKLKFQYLPKNPEKEEKKKIEKMKNAGQYYTLENFSISNS